MSDHARLEAVVHGRVQGVGFRYYALREARVLGLLGWVANEDSGRVRVVAEGPAADLERLLEALREGPPGASVDRVDEVWPAPSGTLGAFEVRSGWHAGD
jgi:acylphosphatase